MNQTSLKVGTLRSAKSIILFLILLISSDDLYFSAVAFQFSICGQQFSLLVVESAIPELDLGQKSEFKCNCSYYI